MQKIPNADISLSPLTLGTMTWGSPVAHKDAVALTRYAFERGINHIDTANMYEGYDRYAGSAGGVAETIVGEALKGLPRDQVIVATKVGMKVGTAPEDEGTSPAAIRTQLERSLKRLDTDYVDLYYLHRYDETAAPEEILETLTKLRQEGKIRYFGISNYTPAQLKELLTCADRNGFDRPVICQPPLSLLEPDAAKELLPLCEQEGIAAVPYQIFQGGLLTGKYRRTDAPPAGSRADRKPGWMMTMDDTLYDRLEELEKAASQAGKTLPQYALSWTLSQPAVISALVGVRTKEQIDDAIHMLK